MAMTPVQEYGFWGMLFLLVVQNAVIPLANKVIPQKVKDAASLERRQLEALETSNKLLAQIIELQRASQSDHKLLIEQSSRMMESVAVLLDREKRNPSPKKKAGTK